MASIIAVKKSSSPGLLLVSGGLVVAGLALVIASLSRKKDINPVDPDETLESPTSTSLAGATPITVRIGATITCLDPMVKYQGPGRDAYSFFQVKQNQGGEWVTVQASGVAGGRLGPTPTLTLYHLVPAAQPQPPGCPTQALCAYVWPGPAPAPICGAPPRPGYADIYLEIYEKKFANDFDGYASPTCNGRIPVARLKLADKILYV